jgi:hypothetical protein
MISFKFSNQNDYVYTLHKLSPIWTHDMFDLIITKLVDYAQLDN